MQSNLIKIEILRNILLTKLRNRLSQILKKYTSEEAKKIVDNVFPRWLMLNHERNGIDAVIPYNAKQYQRIIDDLKYLTKQNNVIVSQILKKWNLLEICKKIIKKLKKDQHLFNVRVKWNDKEVFIIASSNDERGLFYTYNYNVPETLYKKLYDSCIIKDKFLELTTALMIRYDTIYSLNQQLGVIPVFYKALYKKQKFTEMYASALNHVSDKYHSLFYDIEKYFGSLGKIDNETELTDNFYVVNPPYDEDILNNTSNIILSKLEKQNIKFLVIYPSWNNLKAIDILVKSKYITYLEKIPKKRAIFYNHITDTIIKPCNIHLILL